MTKYRLKKDTPFYKKGTEFCEDWFHKGVLLDDYCSVVANLNELDNPDEWFEEVKEPTWVRKQIKQVVYHNAKTDTLNWKYVDVKYRFIKGHFYYDSRTSFSINNKLDESEIRFFENANGDELRRMLGYFNQLIRDGYIEIENNPNIVWEGEDD